MAVRPLKTWNDYRAEVREFDAVLEYSRAVSAALVGRKTPSRRASYAEQIFVKLLAHCVVLRSLSPDPNRRTQNEFWDVPSVSAVARCATEAHDAFEYVVGRSAAELEREFRILLWEAHDKTRRVKMLEAIGSTDPRNPHTRTEAVRLIAQLQAHPHFGSLRADVRKKIAKGDPPAFHFSQRELCQEAGVDYDYYTAITMQLSQYVHTFPFSVHQLFVFKAGTLDALRLMALPLQYVLPFLVRTVEGVRELFPGATPEPPSRTARSMVIWRTISSLGVKSAA